MPDVYDTGASLRTAIRRLQTILSTIYLRAARLRLTLTATPRQSSKPNDHAPTAVRFGNLPQLGVECNLETHRGDIMATNLENGVPGGIRTPNLLIRSQKLYPVELQARD